MFRLLHANFSRLWRNKLFWLGMAAMLLFSVFICLDNNSAQIKYEESYPLESFFFSYTIFAGVFCAAFSSLYIGTEYSDGTMRNKVVIGHRRVYVYLSNLVISIAATLMTCGAFILAMLAVGIPCFGFFEESTVTVLIYFLSSLATVVAFCALFTMLSMLIPSRAVVAAFCLLCFFAMLFVAMHLNARLSEPEYYDSYLITEGTPHMSETPMPNPAYVDGAKRTAYQFLLDFIPTGQAIQLSGMAAIHQWQMPLYSLCILLTTTGIGIWGFVKKDLK